MSFASFYLVKDQSSISIRREVQKISTVFSFIGGMIGAIMGLLFIVHNYTSFSFELAISYRVFNKY